MALGPAGRPQIDGVLKSESLREILILEFRTADAIPFIASSIAAVYSVAKENGNGEVYSGENSMSLNLTADVNGTPNNMNATLKVLTGKIATRTRLICRVLVDEDAADWNAFGVFLTRYDGSESAAAQFFLNSNYGVTNAFQYVTTAGATVTLSELSSFWHAGDSVWLEIEIGVNFVDNVYEYIKVGSQRINLDAAVQVSADTTAPHTKIHFNWSHKDGVSSRRALIDRVYWEEID